MSEKIQRISITYTEEEFETLLRGMSSYISRFGKRCNPTNFVRKASLGIAEKYIKGDFPEPSQKTDGD